MVNWCGSEAQQGCLQVLSCFFGFLEDSLHCLDLSLHLSITLGAMGTAGYMGQVPLLGKAAICCTAELRAIVNDDFDRQSILGKNILGHLCDLLHSCWSLYLPDEWAFGGIIIDSIQME